VSSTLIKLCLGSFFFKVASLGVLVLRSLINTPGNTLNLLNWLAGKSPVEPQTHTTVRLGKVLDSFPRRKSESPQTKHTTIIPIVFIRNGEAKWCGIQSGINVWLLIAALPSRLDNIVAVVECPRKSWGKRFLSSTHERTPILEDSPFFCLDWARRCVDRQGDTFYARPVSPGFTGRGKVNHPY